MGLIAIAQNKTKSFLKSELLWKNNNNRSKKKINTFCTPSRETRLEIPYVLYPKPWNTAR